jgi:NadR type nicotinamide-nucleotide adenylyltransferase
MAKRNSKKDSSLLKVVLIGPESTGKTTLAKALSENFNTTWVEEYCRDFALEKWNKYRKNCESTDVIHIAKGQINYEREGLKEARNLLICDTDILETIVYGKIYYSKNYPVLEDYITQNYADLYLLTYIDVPWEEDIVRENPNNRLRDFNFFLNELQERNLNFIVLKGSKKNRFEKAKKIIQKNL